MEKLLAMYAAAQLTNASCGNVGSNLAVSQDVSDATVRAKNLQVWETFRIVYVAIVGALNDSTSWPEPAIPVGNLMPSLVQSLGPLVTGSGPLAGIAGQVLNFLTSRVAAQPKPPTTPVPNPGVKS